MMGRRLSHQPLSRPVLYTSMGHDGLGMAGSWLDLVLGLYYSYYKTIIEAPSLYNGLHSIMYDNITEYPNVINVLKRFNLYPESLILYIFLTGLGEPAYFYIESVFLLNGVMMMVFFFFGAYLSESILGGFLTVMFFFYNHGECTRVQWTPPLRESFAYPFFVMQMFVVTKVLRCHCPSYKDSILIALVTVCFMLPWQFAQFALVTQTVAVFATYVLTFIGSHKMKIILSGQALGLVISYICLFGNKMLLTSFFAACLITVTVIVLLESWLEKLYYRLVILVNSVRTLSIKLLLAKVLAVADDAHIADLLRSKFTDFKSFHTMLYTCAAEFDFMEQETPWRVLKTLLAPCAITVMLTTVAMTEKKYTNGDTNSQKTTDRKQDDYHREHRSRVHAEAVYHILQLLAFTVMAVIIMRLKLFWTPHLCLISSLLASSKLFGWLGPSHYRYALVAVVVAAATIQGLANLKHQWSILGEFSNIPQEQLVEWVNNETPSGAVFAGPMPTMATIKLCTNRPIVNHPHYEDAGLRERTKKVYTLYSRKSEEEVWRHLISLQVNYTILEESWCLRRSRIGCGMAEVWDLEDVDNRGKPPVCARLHKMPEPYFKSVFRNSIYDVLKVIYEPNKVLNKKT
ncbi:hypothetical protein LSH36_436g06053 [Paralvinella palmiformis]|uniref:C-mannosyltransferase DPY19L1 n=1 Tax=Paralvinella palmiformis TaxID=53620 RepID=A0AAD9JB29_9ANNE|nr:hypothetical protein LSH36_436g06053 [Paralvinella palmiformis]